MAATSQKQTETDPIPLPAKFILTAPEFPQEFIAAGIQPTHDFIIYLVQPAEKGLGFNRPQHPVQSDPFSHLSAKRFIPPPLQTANVPLDNGIIISVKGKWDSLRQRDYKNLKFEILYKFNQADPKELFHAHQLIFFYYSLATHNQYVELLQHNDAYYENYFEFRVQLGVILETNPIKSMGNTAQYGARDVKSFLFAHLQPDKVWENNYKRQGGPEGASNQYHYRHLFKTTTFLADEVDSHLRPLPGWLGFALSAGKVPHEKDTKFNCSFVFFPIADLNNYSATTTTTSNDDTEENSQEQQQQKQRSIVKLITVDTPHSDKSGSHHALQWIDNQPGLVPQLYDLAQYWRHDSFKVGQGGTSGYNITVNGKSTEKANGISTVYLSTPLPRLDTVNFYGYMEIWQKLLQGEKVVHPAASTSTSPEEDNIMNISTDIVKESNDGHNIEQQEEQYKYNNNNNNNNSDFLMNETISQRDHNSTITTTNTSEIQHPPRFGDVTNDFGEFFNMAPNEGTVPLPNVNSNTTNTTNNNINNMNNNMNSDNNDGKNNNDSFNTHSNNLDMMVPSPSMHDSTTSPQLDQALSLQFTPAIPSFYTPHTMNNVHGMNNSGGMLPQMDLMTPLGSIPGSLDHGINSLTQQQHHHQQPDPNSTLLLNMLQQQFVLLQQKEQQIQDLQQFITNTQQQHHVQLLDLIDKQNCEMKAMRMEYEAVIKQKDEMLTSKDEYLRQWMEYCRNLGVHLGFQDPLGGESSNTTNE